MSAVAEAPYPAALPLNPKAVAFVSSRSVSEGDSPVRCSSEEGSSEDLREREERLAEMSEPQHAEEPAGRGCTEDVGPSGRQTIPAPTPTRPRGLSPQRNNSSTSLSSGCASPPIPVLPHPGMVPAYGWGAPIPVYHVYPPPPPPQADGSIERSASPPAVFPAGGSPPLPTGFISVPLHALADPSSPTSRHIYASSPPPMYGSSPPGMAGSPPGMVYLPPPPLPHMMHHGGDYGMAHAGYAMQQQQEFVQRMAGMSLSQPPPGQQQQQQQQQAARPSSNGTGGGGSSGAATSGRLEQGRASARIARSHRAGGAYNPQEFHFDLAEAESGRPDARRTVMVRNIPNKYTQEMMLSVLHKSGFSGLFDFFYLPIDFRNKCNLGYCFINFLDAAAAARLYRDFHKKRWEEYNSKKVCEVTYGRVQGRDTLIHHFRASKFPSDEAEFMPLVYTRVQGGVASDPVPIHQYLEGSSGGSSPTAAAAVAAGVVAAAGREAAGSGDEASPPL